MSTPSIPVSKILVVDDERPIRRFLNISLGDRYQVMEAESGEEALRAAAIHRPDVIILDVRLPGMDGLTAMDELQRATGGAPIVIITAFGKIENFKPVFQLVESAPVIENWKFIALKPPTLFGLVLKCG